MGSEQCWLYTTSDDGQTLTFRDTPRPTEGYSIIIQVRFDYRHKDVWYIGANGKDGFNRDLEPEWYRTRDSCKTFERVTRMGNLVGVFGEDTYIEFPRFQQVLWQPQSWRGSPVVKSFVDTLRADTLPWLPNMYRDLFPGVTNGNVVIQSLANVDDDDVPSNETFCFHPELPGVFIVRVEIDSNNGSEWSHKSACVATTNYGATWQWVIRPLRFLSSMMSLDPARGYVWFSFRGGDDSATAQIPRLLRVTPWAVSVPSALSSHEPLSAWPNPAHDVAYVEVDVDPSTIDYVLVTDNLGNSLQVPVTTEHSARGTRLSIAVADLSSGSYRVLIHSSMHTSISSVVVFH